MKLALISKDPDKPGDAICRFIGETYKDGDPVDERKALVEMAYQCVNLANQGLLVVVDNNACKIGSLAFKIYRNEPDFISQRDIAVLRFVTEEVNPLEEAARKEAAGEGAQLQVPSTEELIKRRNVRERLDFTDPKD